MRRHRRKRRETEEVSLNLAAMLDMAFQLLAFFILTFRPNPVEGQINLNLPPAHQEVRAVGPPIPGPPEPGLADAAKTLTITIDASKQGQVASIRVGLEKLFEGPLNDGRLRQFERRLRDVFSIDRGFDRVVLRVGKTLDYGELMKLVEVCTKQKMSDGKPATRISFVELPEKE